MGASDARIIFSVMLVEARPSLVLGAAISITTILAYSAMSGFVGGGGLGTIAINYGYYRYRSDVMLVTVTLLVVIVQAFQEIGMRLARYIDKRART
jgi:D-methionine transport system permease protein